MMKQSPHTPKQTFSNLPADKRQRIIAAAVREFAANGYQQASLNRIVKELGIAKGSLYQYFKNKEALFLYVFECFTELVKQRVRDEAGATEATGDLFDQVRAILRAGIGFINSHPDYFQIYLQVLFEAEVPLRAELIAKVRLFSAEFFGPLCAAAQQKNLIRRDVEPTMVVFLLDALLDRFLQGYARPYLDGGLGLATMGETELDHHINQIIEVLRDGLSAKH